jgi:single-stranded-DNA-specific exonuclease
MTQIKPRIAPAQKVHQLISGGIHPLLARLYAARGVTNVDQTRYAPSGLIPPAELKGAHDAASLLADAIEAGSTLVIVADYDCDGATACAVGVRGLRMMGADVRFIVPNRFEYGYGLTPPIVDLAAQLSPDLLITVDNGIASIEGVAAARDRGIACLITDHHLPGDTLPDADVIVNPNQPGCAFPSKTIAGVGVMFYVLLALRAELRARGAFQGRDEPNLANLLDLVALGTVADVVKLDHNNRILVSQGLSRIRQNRMCPGLRALFSVAGRGVSQASTFDLGFALGPRLNAAGRLSDMTLGITLLTTDDEAQALNIAQQLDTLNRERRVIEADMTAHADRVLETLADTPPAAVCLFHADWHQGVIGILASRVKDKLHRPTFAFARGEPGEIKGSGRSIPGLHLRDALDLISKREPDLLKKFGGHSAAAGVTLREGDFERFNHALIKVAGEWMSESELTRSIETDGPLESAYLSLEIARLLEHEIWGQGFAPPVFDDIFEVESQKLLKDKHLKLRLCKNGTRIEAIRFNHPHPAPDRIHAAYRLSINEFNGLAKVEMMIEHFEPA